MLPLNNHLHLKSTRVVGNATNAGKRCFYHINMAPNIFSSWLTSGKRQLIVLMSIDCFCFWKKYETRRNIFRIFFLKVSNERSENGQHDGIAIMKVWWVYCAIWLFKDGDAWFAWSMFIHVTILNHERTLTTVGPLIIESLWTKNRVSTGALGALDDPLVVQTKIWKSVWVCVDSTYHL